MEVSFRDAANYSKSARFNTKTRCSVRTSGFEKDEKRPTGCAAEWMCLCLGDSPLETDDDALEVREIR